MLCDKPLATTVADAERAVAACDAAGVRLGITFQTRNHEGMRDIRDLLAGGGIGSVRLVQVELGPGRKLPQNWRTDPGLAGLGVMNNLGVHAYDLLRYLLGAEVVEATAVVDVEPGLEVDTAGAGPAPLRQRGAAYVNANQSLPNPQQNLAVHGTEGSVIGREVTRPNLTGSISVTGREGSSERSVSSAGAFVATIGNFADAVLEGRDPSPVRPGRAPERRADRRARPVGEGAADGPAGVLTGPLSRRRAARRRPWPPPAPACWLRASRSRSRTTASATVTSGESVASTDTTLTSPADVAPAKAVTPPRISSPLKMTRGGRRGAAATTSPAPEARPRRSPAG